MGMCFLHLWQQPLILPRRKISKHECFSLSQDAESPINWWACMKIKKPLGNPCGNPMAGDPPTWRASMRRVHHSGSVQHEHGCRCQEHQSCPEQLNHSSWSNQKKHQSKRFDLKAKKNYTILDHTTFLLLKSSPTSKKKRITSRSLPPTRRRVRFVAEVFLGSAAGRWRPPPPLSAQRSKASRWVSDNVSWVNPLRVMGWGLIFCWHLMEKP